MPQDRGEGAPRGHPTRIGIRGGGPGCHARCLRRALPEGADGAFDAGVGALGGEAAPETGIGGASLLRGWHSATDTDGGRGLGWTPGAPPQGLGQQDGLLGRLAQRQVQLAGGPRHLDAGPALRAQRGVPAPGLRGVLRASAQRRRARGGPRAAAHAAAVGPAARFRLLGSVRASGLGGEPPRGGAETHGQLLEGRSARSCPDVEEHGRVRRRRGHGERPPALGQLAGARLSRRRGLLPGTRHARAGRAQISGIPFCSNSTAWLARRRWSGLQCAISGSSAGPHFQWLAILRVGARDVGQRPSRSSSRLRLCRVGAAETVVQPAVNLASRCFASESRARLPWHELFAGIPWPHEALELRRSDDDRA
mmetsp:Transcript_86871/g.280657  ORF Transcript_86871/g.280657 Transcript_86871/m.280657 type:complete len:366 (+) Transcript_86871:424-1521(+)